MSSFIITRYMLRYFARTVTVHITDATNVIVNKYLLKYQYLLSLLKCVIYFEYFTIPPDKIPSLLVAVVPKPFLSPHRSSQCGWRRSSPLPRRSSINHIDYRNSIEYSALCSTTTGSGMKQRFHNQVID